LLIGVYQDEEVVRYLYLMPAEQFKKPQEQEKIRENKSLNGFLNCSDARFLSFFLKNPCTHTASRLPTRGMSRQSINGAPRQNQRLWQVLKSNLLLKPKSIRKSIYSADIIDSSLK